MNMMMIMYTKVTKTHLIQMLVLLYSYYLVITYHCKCTSGERKVSAHECLIITHSILRDRFELERTKIQTAIAALQIGN